ncbi:HEAT repeat domain-containing protein [Homoserinibacter sp. YIM 151385]|uniref:HEAT repeat domain-containing protein n=1 Tax=Homoserinibacter sp. YIM 151385 TaxID=2985506 RepID=UPI0022F0B3EC|nr:HEAT repeat domain-containing protein [Homoserinibacter sp. YIM 151385]WBU37259.1 HEAT repeat domain-containing protein [Homoserinibacter sp. YIM 151385]
MSETEHGEERGMAASTPAARLAAALAASDGSVRLQAALTAGTAPDPGFIPVLVARCAVEPDFGVRDMMTWALVRQEREATLERLLAELGSAAAQARSQALHTLSKLGEARAWPAITPELLRDPDDEVARAAWRTAAGLVPEAEAPALAALLAGQLGRGAREVQRSLSRAMAMLGTAAEASLEAAERHPDPEVGTHAIATRRIMDDPDSGFDAAVADARRQLALRAAPAVDEERSRMPGCA